MYLLCTVLPFRVLQVGSVLLRKKIKYTFGLIPLYLMLVFSTSCFVWHNGTCSSLIVTHLSTELAHRYLTSSNFLLLCQLTIPTVTKWSPSLELNSSSLLNVFLSYF